MLFPSGTRGQVVHAGRRRGGLLTEIDPDDHDHAFGLCDLGMGMPELGWVSLQELATVRGKLGLGTCQGL